MKKGTLFILLCCISIFSIACEIKLHVSDKYVKENYSPGEELIVEVEVILTHRVCDVSINDSKVTSSGCEIVGATKWVENSPGTFTRKLKVKVLDDGKPELKLNCRRTCDKEGGASQLVLKKK